MLTCFLKDRHLILEMVRRDLRDRYAGSVLGVVWNVVHPLVMIFIYTVIFAKVMGTKLPGVNKDPLAYSVYLCSGLFPWLAFQDILNRVTSQFVDNAPLLQRAIFKKEVLVWTVWISALLTFVISFCVFVCFLIGVDVIRAGSAAETAAPPTARATTASALTCPHCGKEIGEKKLGQQIAMAQRDQNQRWFNPPMIPLYLLMVFCLTMLAAGIGTALACLNVFLRDTAQLLSVVLLFWFWLTPIVWPFDPLSFPRMAKLMWANPLYAYIQSFQQLIVYQKVPGPWVWAATIGAAVAAILIGGWTLKCAEPYLADEL